MKKLLTLALGVFILSACSTTKPAPGPSSASPATPTTPVVSTAPKANPASSFTGSLMDLLGMTDTKKCTLNISNTNTNITGTYYISGGKVRGTMQTLGQGKGTPIEMNTMVDKEYMYFWMEKPIAFGSKTSLAKLAQMGKDLGAGKPTSGTLPIGQTPDLGAKQLFDCQSWTADPSMFIVPSNIKFIGNN